MRNTALSTIDLNIEEQIIEKVSKEIIDSFNNFDDSTEYNKLNLIVNIKNKLKEELEEHYSSVYNESDFEEVFDNNEDKILEYLEFKHKLNNVKNSEIFKKNKKNNLEKNTFQIKQYIDLVLVKAYKKNLEKFERISQLSKIITFENRFKSTKGDFFKEVKHLYKIELVNFIRSFKNACILPFAKKNELFLIRILKFICLSIPLVLSAFISFFSSIILFLFWQFNNLFAASNKLIKKKLAKLTNIIVSAEETKADKFYYVKRIFGKKCNVSDKKLRGYKRVAFFLNALELFNNKLMSFNKIIANYLQKTTGLINNLANTAPKILIEKTKKSNNINGINSIEGCDDLSLKMRNRTRLQLMKMEKKPSKAKPKQSKYVNEKRLEKTAFIEKTEEIIEQIKTKTDKELYSLDMENKKTLYHDKFMTKVNNIELIEDLMKNPLLKEKTVEKVIDFNEIQKNNNLDNLKTISIVEKKRLEYQKQTSYNENNKVINLQQNQNNKLANKFSDIYLVLDDFKSEAQYKDLMKLVKDDKVKQMYLVGHTGEKIKKDLANSNIKKEITLFKNIDEVMTKLKVNNIKNDVVVLSPKAAIYQLYKTYKAHSTQLQTTLNRLR